MMFFLYDTRRVHSRLPQLIFLLLSSSNRDSDGRSHALQRRSKSNNRLQNRCSDIRRRVDQLNRVTKSGLYNRRRNYCYDLPSCDAVYRNGGNSECDDRGRNDLNRSDDSSGIWTSFSLKTIEGGSKRELTSKS